MKRMTFGLFILSIFPLSAFAQGAPPQLAAQGFTSSKVCGQCHVSIFEGWKGSMHANAVTDPIFYPIFLETSRETSGKSDSLCLSCHAPTTRVTKDWQMKEPLTQEGVTCDFCHSIRNVNLSARDPFEVIPGKTKWGPLKNVSSPAHQASYAEVYEKAELCATCHEFKNDRGAPVLETYSEWTKSPQSKEGMSCQTCHMPKISGLVVPPKVKPTNEIYIHSHEAAGGHSIDQVRKAVTIKIVEAKRSGEKMTAVVRLENIGSGHKVPTGLPTRKLVLRFQASSGGVPFFAQERIYQKVLVNEKGEIITKDADLFLRAAKVKEDNRLEPRKPQTEYFTLLVPEGKPVEVEATVYYLYQPRLIQETEMKVNLGSQKTVVPNP